jgi:arginyl-tRNA synthetase
MHVGHLRSTIIGDVLVRLHEFLGNQVIRRNHVGDWGTQFGMLLAYLEELQHDKQELSWELKNLEDFYRKAKLRFDQDLLFASRAREYVTKLQAEDSELITLWQQFVQISMSHCQEIYERLQVTLVPADAVGESFYNNLLPTMVETLMQRGVAINNDGAKCVFFAPGELATESAAPFIIQKQDGGYLYSTTDIAAAYERVHHLHADLLLYVIDSRQSLHMQQLFAAVKKAQLVKSTTVMEHIAFGTMLDQNNRPFKTRSGDTIKLTALIDAAVAKAMEIISQRNPEWEHHRKETLAEILGIAAIKYADLSKNRLSDYIFNLDQMLAFDGNTAPYLLYAYVRIHSLFGKCNGLSPTEYKCGKITIGNTKERNLALHLSKFTDVILQATAESYPHYLCSYAYELAVAFMNFYESCPIMQEDTAVRESRLSLASLVALVLRTVFDLLGIPVTDRM